MNLTAGPHRLWKDMSIRTKLTFVLGILLGFVWAVVFLNVYQLQHLTYQSGHIMRQYDQITAFINAFSAENICMDAYVRPSHTAEDETAYAEAVKRTDLALAALTPDLDRDVHEEYMLKRAISNAMKRYRGDYGRFMQAVENRQRVEWFVLLQRQAIYINQYSLELLQLRMEEGEESWRGIETGNRQMIRIIFGCMLAATALTALGLYLLVSSFLRPILKISLAADAISAGNYDHPPLPEGGNDEIGRTARSFNIMQTQVKQTIRAMEREAEMEKENARIQKALQESRYAELQSQMNPHFLFNTLNAIAALANEEKAPVTEDLIERLSKIFRYSLETREQQVTLGDELQYLGDYMELMDARFAGRISMDIEPFDESLKDRIVPKFMLQTLAENAILHGFRDVREGGEIDIRICEIPDGSLQIVVADNGCGFDSSTLEEQPPARQDGSHHAMGLANIRERLAYLGGTMTVDSEPDAGTRITITIGKDSGYAEGFGSRG